MNKYSFKELLSNEIETQSGMKSVSTIRIPMIQRDYAQGRSKEERVRNRFLAAIFEVLTGKKEYLELDFIYGSTTANGDGFDFIPLDGQQRLTTLFLLYWYIGNREIAGDEEKVKELKEIFRKFTYQTRPSSSRFCDKLSDCFLTFTDTVPSKVIKNQSWFYLSFKKDPTIQAMLLMLDTIHEIYNLEGQNDLLERLEKVQFYVLPLDDFKMTDELYIKMNARGKQLKSYENFKADFIKWLKQDLYKDRFSKKITYKGKKMPFYLSVSIRLDNDWTDLFWEESDGKVVDSRMMNFFHRYLLNEYIINRNVTAKGLAEGATFNYFYGKSGNDRQVEYNNFAEYETIFSNEQVVEKICIVLDELYQHYPAIREVMRPVW